MGRERSRAVREAASRAAAHRAGRVEPTPNARPTARIPTQPRGSPGAGHDRIGTLFRAIWASLLGTDRGDPVDSSVRPHPPTLAGGFLPGTRTGWEPVRDLRLRFAQVEGLSIPISRLRSIGVARGPWLVGCRRGRTSPCRPRATRHPPLRSLYLKELDLEEQGGIGRDDAPRAPAAVAQVGRDDQLPLSADLHGGDTLVPALDDLTLTHVKRERLTAVLGAIELLALLVVLPQPAGVVHHT